MKKMILIFTILLSTVSLAFGTIINVPADQPTIQDGLDAASVNDTILVAEGTYFENIEWPDTDGIILISEAGAANTIIDGNEQGRVFHIPQACTLTNATVVDGFTIQNGYYSGSTPHPGGGIADYGGLTWSNNIIKDNFASGLGGGLILAGGFPLIFNNVIIDNTSADACGAICVSWCSAEIRNNTIVGNSADNGSGGGGIVLFYATGTTIIEDNVIVNNSADGTNLGGGGIMVLYSECSLDYNNVWGNTPNNYAECSAGPNSISEDPMFVSSNNGSYFIDQTTSLCLNAGSQTAIEAGLDEYTTSYEAVLDIDQVDIGFHYNPAYFDPTDADEDIVLPDETLLLSNYPNPFNPSTTISFSTTENTESAEIIIYNLKGQKIKQLVSDQLSAGQHSVVWDGKDENGKSATSGIYFYQLKAGKYEQTKKMILMK